MALALALACIPYASALGANGGLRQYGERWEGFNLGFRLLRAATLALAPPATDGLTLAHWARGAAAAILILVLAVAWKRARDSVDFGRTAVLGCVLLAPVLHPWYLTWLLPFLLPAPGSRAVLAGRDRSLLYAPLAGWKRGAGWVEPAWLWPVVAGPFALLLVLRLLRERRARAAGCSALPCPRASPHAVPSRMRLSEFDFELPPERIAQRPADPRDAARLLVHGIDAQHTEHAHVSDLRASCAAATCWS
jgi:hypothetical protein